MKASTAGASRGLGRAPANANEDASAALAPGGAAAAALPRLIGGRPPSGRYTVAGPGAPASRR